MKNKYNLTPTGWLFFIFAVLGASIVILSKNGIVNKDSYATFFSYFQKKTEDNSNYKSNLSLPDILTIIPSAGKRKYKSGIDFKEGTYIIKALKGKGVASITNGRYKLVIPLAGPEYSASELMHSYSPVPLTAGAQIKIKANTTDFALKIINENTLAKKESDEPGIKKKTISQDLTAISPKKKYFFLPGMYTAGRDFLPGIYRMEAYKGKGKVTIATQKGRKLILLAASQKGSGKGEATRYNPAYKNIILEKGCVINISAKTPGFSIRLIHTK